MEKKKSAGADERMLIRETGQKSGYAVANHIVSTTFPR